MSGFYDTAQNVQIAINRALEGDLYHEEIREFMIYKLQEKMKEFPEDEVAAATNSERRKQLSAARQINTAMLNKLKEAYDASITYLTAERYVKYIKPEEFPSAISTNKFNKAAKYAFGSGEDYSRAGADVSNSLIITGGRNVSILDFKNAIDTNNPLTASDTYFEVNKNGQKIYLNHKMDVLDDFHCCDRLVGENIYDASGDYRGNSFLAKSDLVDMYPIINPDEHMRALTLLKENTVAMEQQ